MHVKLHRFATDVATCKTYNYMYVKLHRFAIIVPSCKTYKQCDCTLHKSYSCRFI